MDLVCAGSKWFWSFSSFLDLMTHTILTSHTIRSYSVITYCSLNEPPAFPALFTYSYCVVMKNKILYIYIYIYYYGFKYLLVCKYVYLHKAVEVTQRQQSRMHSSTCVRLRMRDTPTRVRRTELFQQESLTVFTHPA